MLAGMFEFIIKLVFNCVSLLVLLRFLLQCVKVNFFHPLVQMLVRVTNPIVLPVRRVTPVFSSWDWSCIVVAMAAGVIKYLLLMLIWHMALSPLVVVGMVVIDILQDILTLYFYAVIFVAICSWFRASPNARVVLDILEKLTNPLMRILKFNVRYRGIDFKPMIVLFIIMMVQSGLYIVKTFLANLNIG